MHDEIIMIFAMCCITNSFRYSEKYRICMKCSMNKENAAR